MIRRLRLHDRLDRMVLAALWAVAVSWAFAAQAATTGAVRVDAVEVELVSDRAAVVPGQPMQLGLRIRHDPQWHTYWRNPGDSGLPTQIAWTVPPGFEAGDIRWPAPQRLFIGPLANYGYEGEIVLPVPLSVPTAIDGDRARFAGKASWLMCREVCIPGEADVALELPVRRDGAAPPSRFVALFDEAAQRTPHESIASPVFAEGGRLSIGLPGKPSTAEFFPYREGLLKNAAPQVLRAAEGEGVGARLDLGLTDEGARKVQGGGDSLRAAAEGIVIVDGQVREIAASVAAHDWPAGVVLSRIDGAAAADASDAAGASSGFALRGLLRGFDSRSPRFSLPGSASVAAGDSAAGTLPPAGAASTSLWIAALFGVLGGLILNLMPCVFPVVGLKVLGFARYGGEAQASSRLGAIAFAAGVLVSFWVLAALLLGLRAAGAAAGWGFQLQSPAFVAAMALLFVAIGLNFSGVYEFGVAMTRLGRYDTPGPNAHPLAGSFVSGVLAVLVATPCTAPFMGSALGYTLGSGAAEALFVFTAIAIGMALPYLLLGFFPAWLRWLPRPGRWMETFRQVLAFPMYATAAWLAWVLGRQAGVDAVFALAIGAVLLGLAAWLYGRFVQVGHAGGARAKRPLAAALALAAFAIACWIAWPAALERSASADASGSANARRASADASDWQPWSSRRVREALDAGRPVFVEFTAAWCVSCQVNKRLVLDRDAVVEAMSRHGVLRLQADWTSRDREITAELARFGRNGVPLYLLYRPGDASAQMLPELLTTGIVLDALARLGPGASGL